MDALVAFGAQCDEVLFLIATRLAAKSEVVYLQLLHASANLAAPAIALQYLPMQLAIGLRIQSRSWVLAESLLHDAFRLMSDRKISCCGVGRNL